MSILTSFVSTAAAQDGAPVGFGSGFVAQLFPIILILIVMYFLVIRPSMKKQRKLRDSISQLKLGDRVLTAGGIEGKVVDLGDEHKLKLEIADGVVVTVVKATISGVLTESFS